ncbi:MAG: nucleoside triphosphate pyrophosphohydrolase [Candidatus Cloacimonadota bacterium]|nr:MAG: nucleoside triphosphate pyrophosphohydrolase [Candidatus Cloacimonadota bacterium]
MSIQREVFEKIIDDLRDKTNGCPWDLKQTHSSLKKYFLEEVYEFLDEVDNDDFDAMEDELGDVLLQIYLHAQLLKEETNNKINIESIAKKISEKMVRRHPHVFDKKNHDKNLSLAQNWQKIKDEEGKSQTVFTRKGHPIFQMEQVLKKVKSETFRFSNFEQSLDQVQEELEEVREVYKQDDGEKRLKEELGDLLLSVCSSISELNFSSEELLLSAMNKFCGRYEKMGSLLNKEDLILNKLSEEEKQNYWDLAKSYEK